MLKELSGESISAELWKYPEIVGYHKRFYRTVTWTHLMDYKALSPYERDVMDFMAIAWQKHNATVRVV